QGGQSPAAISMAAECSDWMFLNGGPPEKIARIVEAVRKQAGGSRRIRFALYAIPVCSATDTDANRHVDKLIASIDGETAHRRRARTSGAHGMWSPSDDPLTLLDSNEGYASRLIGSPETIIRKMLEFHAIGIECFHLTLHSQLFNREVLPALRSL